MWAAGSAVLTEAWEQKLTVILLLFRELNPLKDNMVSAVLSVLWGCSIPAAEFMTILKLT